MPFFDCRSPRAGEGRCNNNEFQSRTLVENIIDAAKARGTPYLMPFRTEYFKKSISEHVGVWSTNVNKLGGLQTLITLMQDARLVVWNRYVSFCIAANVHGALLYLLLIIRGGRCITIGSIYLKRLEAPTATAAIDILRDELVQFKETDKGPSGKTPSTNDDAAMALIMACYWSFCVRASGMFQ